MTPNEAHKWTDRELKALERRIKQEYTRAYRELKKEMAEIMQKISVNPNMSLQQKMAIMQKYDRLEKLCEQMAEVLRNTNATAVKFINGFSAQVYAQNYNAMASDLSFSLLDNAAVKKILTGETSPFTKLAIDGIKDKSVILRKLESELTTAILKGESIPQMAKRLKNVSEGYLSNTVRIARTETTRVENSAKMDVGEQGKKYGYNMWKRWISTPDERTRQEHLDADRQEVPQDEPFVVGGEEMMYPGDISLGASGWNTINCRCTMINFIKDEDNKK